MLNSLIDLVEERCEKDAREALREFSHAYLRRLAGERSFQGDVDALFNEVAGVFEFASARDGNPIAVRAFNPTLEEHGYLRAGSVLETNTGDLPFLVDSLTAELVGRDIGILRVIHPIIGTERDEQGRIIEVKRPAPSIAVESVMHFDLDRRLDEAELRDLEAAAREILSGVQAVVRDFRPMVDRVERMVAISRGTKGHYPEEQIEDTVAFLEWLTHDNFIFLGYREYEISDNALQTVPDSGLGLLTDASSSAFLKPVAIDSLSPRLQRQVLRRDLPIISKTNRLSPVHQRRQMDYIAVRKLDENGVVTHHAMLLGLFTLKAFARSISETPILARKLREILRSEEYMEGSHDYKSAVATFESFPRDELLAAPVEDLRRAIEILLSLQPESMRLLGRRDADGRSVSLIVVLPRGVFSESILDDLRDLIWRRFNASEGTTHEVLTPDHARLHFMVFSTGGEVPDVSFEELEGEIVELSRTWDELVRELLTTVYDQDHSRALAGRWLELLPESYKASVTPESAVLDIEAFHRLSESGETILVGIKNESSEAGELTRIGVFRRGPRVELSAVMRILEDLGLRVTEERLTRLVTEEEIWLQDFGVLGPDDLALKLDEVSERISECITAIWQGRTETDPLNRLVANAGLDWRQVSILRAYRKYRQRIGSAFTEEYQHEVITSNSHIIAKLIGLFEQRFDPSIERNPYREEELRQEIVADLDSVTSLDHDRILRNQLGLIDATVRTNVYKPGRKVISFKFRSADVPAIPEPAPLFEIYVYSPSMEGIHLRGGAIARGGIRWSDRMDYRTEVFGLMRAQMTKNAIIVPTGAKGGFYLKQHDPKRQHEQVREEYMAYIGGLLDLTDNLVDGKVVHPEGVRVLDDHDTYLVVAADKGTAKFSDTANEVASTYGFWLGDAFASGGSKGYDHKALGITARGAWESLKRHFRSLDLHPAVDIFTVVGIGDMSGDVFGNGMLLSNRIKLVAAYDHRHVFIDPNPDPEASFAERKRLFELPGSSWADYNRELISPGGGVWPRSAKRIPLFPEVRAMLGVEVEELPPNEVIRAVLQAPVDVLWNGGIGTIVKSSLESDEDAHDRSSHGIRVDASELRCRVAVEGGNLGFTQRARIEFARSGGLINADFIDNSAGVDCSDHEVNLKILLDLAVRRGELQPHKRDQMLVDATDDVAEHVLYDSYLQAQILDQEVRLSGTRLFAYEDLIVSLEAEGLLSRENDALPSVSEMAARERSSRGLERPELAVLVAIAKRSLTAAVQASDLPNDPYLEQDLEFYFPTKVVKRFRHLFSEHPLRRELIATRVSNDIVDSLGPTFVSRLVVEQGVDVPAVVRAYRIAHGVTGPEAPWFAIEDLDQVLGREIQWEVMESVDWLMEATTRWYVLNASDADIGTSIAKGKTGFERLITSFPELVSDSWLEERKPEMVRLKRAGVPSGMAWAHIFTPLMIHAPNVIWVAQETGRSIEEVAKAFIIFGERLRFSSVEDRLDALPAVTRMQRWAQQAVSDDLLRARRDLAVRAFRESPKAKVPEAVQNFFTTRQVACDRYERFVRNLTRDEAGDLTGLTLAVRQLGQLAD